MDTECSGARRVSVCMYLLMLLLAKALGNLWLCMSPSISMVTGEGTASQMNVGECSDLCVTELDSARRMRHETYGQSTKKECVCVCVYVDRKKESVREKFLCA